jgi:hypothetical protein
MDGEHAFDKHFCQVIEHSFGLHQH